MTPTAYGDDGVVLPSDIQMAAYLGSLTAADDLPDRAARMQPAEVALMALPVRWAA
jgi:hypothetical protein